MATPQFIDTHTHLATTAYKDNLNEVLQRSREAGVNQWICIGTTLEDSQACIDLCKTQEKMTCSVGIHPHEAQKQPSDYISQLEHLSSQPKVCAYGEIGLDYHYDFSPRDIQQKVFEEQLPIAISKQLPIVIHCREAITDTLEILKDLKNSHSVVFHCFSSDTKDAKAILDSGFWLSFTGTITFKKATENQKAAEYAPLDRIMLETDCPYLSPDPMRKIKPNEPALLVHTAQKLANLKRVSIEEISEVTMNNSRSFFQLDK